MATSQNKSVLNSPPPQGVANLCEHIGNTGLLNKVLFLLPGQIIIYCYLFTPAAFLGEKKCIQMSHWRTVRCHFVKGEGQGFSKAMKMLTGKYYCFVGFFLIQIPESASLYKDKQFQ